MICSAILALAAAAWWRTAARMRLGGDLGALGWFLGVWW